MNRFRRTTRLAAVPISRKPGTCSVGNRRSDLTKDCSVPSIIWPRTSDDSASVLPNTLGPRYTVKMNVHAPIGIFDSGLGGLSVAREIRRLLPAERLLYVADSRFCPYGTRSNDEIRWRSLLIAEA